MKKLFTLVVSIVLLSQSSFAQLTLTSAIGFMPGNSYSFQPCDISDTVPSAAGANVSVDYSSVTAYGAIEVDSFVDPTTTAYTTTFPTATVAVYTTYTQGNYEVVYYKKSATKIEVLGGFRVGTDTVIIPYSNSASWLTFPMTYQDSTVDNFKAQYSEGGLDVIRTGFIMTVADAYGTIKTPAGTSPYLRLKTTQQIVDSFFMAGSFTQLSTYEMFDYYYMNNGSNDPIFTYSEIIIGQGSKSITASYSTTIATGVAESTKSNLVDVNVFPNPAKSSIMLTTNLVKGENVSIKVIDITGKEVIAAQHKSMDAGNNEVALNIASLSSGLYSVVLQSESIGNKAVKFTVE